VTSGANDEVTRHVTVKRQVRSLRRGLQCIAAGTDWLLAGGRCWQRHAAIVDWGRAGDKFPRGRWTMIGQRQPADTDPAAAPWSQAQLPPRELTDLPSFGKENVPDW